MKEMSKNNDTDIIDKLQQSLTEKDKKIKELTVEKEKIRKSFNADI